MTKFKNGDKCFIIESKHPRPVTIIRIDSNFAIVRFDNGGGIRISINRLKTKEEIQDYIVEPIIHGNRSPLWH